MDAGAWTGDALKVAAKAAVKAAAQRIGLNPDDAAACFTALGYVSDWIKNGALIITGPYYDQIRKVRSLMPNQGAIVVAFSNTRKEAFDFIQKNDPAVAQKQFIDIRDGLTAWAGSSALTPGLQADAAELGGIVMSGLNNRMSKVDAEYRKLFDNYKPIFLGTKIDPDVEEKLMQAKTWNDLQAGISGLGLPAVLRQWANSVQVIRSGMGDAFKQLQDNLLGLPQDIYYQLVDQIGKLQSDVLGKLDAIISDTNLQVSECTKIVSDDQVKQDFDRRPMLDALRSSER